MNITIGDFILAPRPRYSVEEVSYTAQLLQGQSCGCNGMVKNWEIVLRVHCIGNGDIAAARRSYSQLEAILAGLCATNKKLYRRSYCNEEPLEYTLQGGYIQPTNLDWLPGQDCCHNTSLSGEVHLTTVDIFTGAELQVYDYVTLVPNDAV